MLTGLKVPQREVNNVTGVLKLSKPYFGWHTQQVVAASTTSSDTRFLCYMCEKRFQLALQPTDHPPSCISLTLQSVLNQNLTCSLTPSWTLDTLKDELKPLFTANVTKNPLLHADKNGGIPLLRTCIMVIRMGSTSVGRICMEVNWTHTTPTSLTVHIKTLKKYIQVDTSSLKLIGELSIPMERTYIMMVRMGSILVGRFSIETIQGSTSSHTSHGNFFTTHVHLMTTNTWTPSCIQQPC